MKSIKPGRGPSAMGVLAGLFGVVFAIFWTIMAVQAGAPFIFPVFGVMFIIMSIAGVVYNFTNATGENRFSQYDITDAAEEPDPWDLRADKNNGGSTYTYYSDGEQSDYDRFCPYCGRELSEDFEYCPKCGKKLPF